MNTAPNSIPEIEQTRYDMGYNDGYSRGIAKHGELCSIIEDMAALFVIISPQDQDRPNVKRAEAAYRKYISNTTRNA